MNKLIKVLAVCVSAFCVMGCNEQKSNETTTEAAVTTTTVSEAEGVTEASINSSSANENICYDYYGTAVDITEVKDTIFVGEKSVTNEGYVYAVISDGQAWNSLTSPELFEHSIDYRMGDMDSYSKISVGDSFGDLVLSEAETLYGYDPYKNEVFIMASCATFDGELTMDGHITLSSVDDSIHFLPESGEWNGLPMVYYADKSGFSADYEYLCNAPRINLEKKDDYTGCDFTLNADYKKVRKVHLTFDNLTLFWLEGNYGTSENHANVVDIYYYSSF